MNFTGKLPQTAEKLKDLLKRLLSLYLDNVKLTVTEKLTVLLSAGVTLVIFLVLGIFSLAFFSGALLELMSIVLPAWASYLILGGFFVLVIVAVALMKKQLIINPISRFISRLMYDESHGHD